MAIDPRVLPIFGVNLVNNPTFTQVAYKFYSDKIQVTRLCEIATKNEADYQRIAKQTNAQWSKLTPIRERYTNATIAAAQPGTIATEEILGWYVISLLSLFQIKQNKTFFSVIFYLSIVLCDFISF